MNYINMGKLSKLFDALDQGVEFRITKEEFGVDFQQISIDVAVFLNKYNRPTILKHGIEYSEIDIKEWE